MISSQDLCDTLGITTEQLKRWRNAGMPCKRDGRKYVYEELAVEKWLLETGKAQRKRRERIETDVREAANAIGIHYRTLLDWHHRPDFPGIPYRRYPIDTLLEWQANFPSSRHDKTNGHPQPTSAKARLDAAKASLAETELAEKRGQLVDADEVARFVERMHGYALLELEQMQGQIMTRLPSELGDNVKSQVREILEDSIKRFCEMMMEATNSQGDEDDNADDQSDPQGSNGESESLGEIRRREAEALDLC